MAFFSLKVLFNCEIYIVGIFWGKSRKNEEKRFEDRQNLEKNEQEKDFIKALAEVNGDSDGEQVQVVT